MRLLQLFALRRQRIALFGELLNLFMERLLGLRHQAWSTALTVEIIAISRVRLYRKYAALKEETPSFLALRVH